MEEIRRLRKECLKISAAGRDGNLQSVFSSMEILYTLYNRIFDLSKIKDKKEDRDIFMLSKGQSTLGLLIILADVGIIKHEDLFEFCRYESRVSMQADYTKFDIGVENAAGSLGHGFPMAVGQAMGAKLKNLHNRIYCLAGDGEMNEGTMWEACILAMDRGLDNLCLIIDDNGSIGSMINMGDIGKKLRGFGFSTYDVNGHNVDELERVFCASNRRDGKPVAVIAKTKRGYGSRSLMENREWFHKYPEEDELEKLMREVDEFEESDGKNGIGVP